MPTKPAPAQPANVAGNWLLLGSLPSAVTRNPAPNAAVSFDVKGGQITGAGTFDFPCTSGSGSVGFGFGAVLAGVVASDGSFTLASPDTADVLSGPRIRLSGSVPKVAGEAWQGIYSATSASGSTAPCTVESTGTFVATAIADLTGTYAGKGSGYFFPGGNAPGNSEPLALTLTLEQGGTLYGGPTPVLNTRLALGGSINVAGIPCFSKGVDSPNKESFSQGTEFSAAFVMDDNSTLSLVGDVLALDASELAILGATIDGGKCAGSYSFGPTPLFVHRS